MNIKTKATNLDLSDAISDYLFKRLEAVNKFTKGDDQSSIMIEVELARTTNHHKSGDIFKAEYNFCIGGDCWRAVAENADLYSAIDKAKDELTRQLRKRKSKRMASIKRGGQRIKNAVRGWFRRSNDNNDSY